MKELREHINHIHPISKDVLDDFLKCWELTTFNKKEVISQYDSTDRYLHFTLRGIQKAYYIAKGKESIIAFTFPYHFTCVPESFLTQTPSKYYFQCITESEFYRISNSDFFKFVENHHEIETFLRKSLINLVVGITERHHKLTMYTIEERFKDFINNSRHLLNHVSQKDIASYLNMNPTNFSKLINSVKI